MLSVRIGVLFEYANHFLGRYARFEHIGAHIEDLPVEALLLERFGHGGVQNARRVAQAAHVRTLECDRSENRVSRCFD